ncbi:uncharacterized protein M6B38_411190 [Iris pallida]|uniref:DCD domain-containing protein n=1 Tax=Iris pallida TaxID=29817 RepID=A0AAX6FMA8_IRIPA|nr:uncharacterized protein M6B38_411190 [Iris pallida]
MAKSNKKEVAASDVPSELEETIGNVVTVVESAPSESVNMEEETMTVVDKSEEEETKKNEKVESVVTVVPEGERVDEQDGTKEVKATEEVGADGEDVSVSNKRTKRLKNRKKKAVASAAASSEKTKEPSTGAVILDEKQKEKRNATDQPGSSTVNKKNMKMADGVGLIFMCNAKTKKDCFRYKVLGLPASKKEMVEKVYMGMRLFLFDVDLKLLYGIYKAASHGGYNLEPRAFKSAFPSQVRFTVLNDCVPLPEEKFKAAIKQNYYGRNKFNCQLSAEQVKNLCKLFKSAGKKPSSRKRPHEDITAEPEPSSTNWDPRILHGRARDKRIPLRIRGNDLYSRREAYASPPPRLVPVAPLRPPPSYVYDRPVDYRRVPLPSVALSDNRIMDVVGMRAREPIEYRDPYALYREPLPYREALFPPANLSSALYAPSYTRY